MLGPCEILLSKHGYFLNNSSDLHNNSGRGLEKLPMIGKITVARLGKVSLNYILAKIGMNHNWRNRIPSTETM